MDEFLNKSNDNNGMSEDSKKIISNQIGGEDASTSNNKNILSEII